MATSHVHVLAAATDKSVAVALVESAIFLVNFGFLTPNLTSSPFGGLS